MWASLDMEQRQRVLRFDDVVLVDRVGVALQTLFQKQAMMNHMGIKLCGTSENPFGNDKLLMNAFEFTWQFCEPKNNPELVVVKDGEMSLLLVNREEAEADDRPIKEHLVQPKIMMVDSDAPLLVLKPNVLMSDDFFERFKYALPDFLSTHTKRMPLPRARWKDLWASEPASITALHEMLAKLVEQALWAMGTHLSFLSPEPAAKKCSADPVVLEPWMEDEKPQVVESKKNRKSMRSRAAREERKLFQQDKKNEEVETSSAAFSKEAELGGLWELPAGNVSAVKPNIASHEGHNAAVSSSLPSAQKECDVVVSEVSTTMDVSTTVEVSELPSLVIDDEESIGLGTFHVGIPDDGCSPKVPCPDRGFVGCFDRNDAAGSFTWQPPQLVCYIWNYACQVSCDSVDDSGNHSPSRKTVSPPPLSVSPSPSRLCRGQWELPPEDALRDAGAVSAVVRKTFIDIDEGPSVSPRHSRSLSPRRPCTV